MAHTEQSRPGKQDMSCKVQIASESDFCKPLITENVYQKGVNWADGYQGVYVDRSFGEPLTYDSGEDRQWGGTIVYKTGSSIEFNGTLAVLQIDGRLTVRYVVRRENEVYLFPINSGYSTIVMEVKEFKEDAGILGIVCGIISKFPQQFMDKDDPFDKPKRLSVKPSIGKRGRPRKAIEQLWKEISRVRKWKDKSNPDQIGKGGKGEKAP